MIQVCIDQPRAVADWVIERLPFPIEFKDGLFQAVGMTVCGEKVAGAIYSSLHLDAFTGEPISMEITMAADSPRWCTRAGLMIFLSYPFWDVGVKRLTAFTSSSNKRAQKVISGVGFRLEGVMKNAMTGGDDCLIYGLLKEDAQRWLGRYMHG